MTAIFTSEQARSDPKNPGTHVFIIGVSEYPHLSGEGRGVTLDEPSDLEVAKDAALSLTQWFRPDDAAIESAARFHNPTAPLATIELLVPGEVASSSTSTSLGADGNPTRSNIARCFESWVGRIATHPDNVGVFYFCGRGAMGGNALWSTDFGAAGSFLGAIDIEANFAALKSSLHGGALYCFLDIYADTAVPFAGTRPEPLLGFDIPSGGVGHLLVLKSVASAGRAFAPPTGIPYFTNALIRALSGEAYTTFEGFDDPVVTSESLVGVVTRRLKSDAPPDAGVTVPEAQFVGDDRPFHFFVLGPPTISDSADPASEKPAADDWPSGQGMSTHIASDVPTTRDTLGYKHYAYAIARFLTHPQSQPPLTVSIQAPWGGGKTSLMQMIQQHLDPEAVERAKAKLARGETHATRNETGPGLTVGEAQIEIGERLANRGEPDLPPIPAAGMQRVTVWFNAWKYENTNQVWAGLIDAILEQVPERLGRIEQERFWLRLNLSRIDSGRVRQRLHSYFIHRWFKTAAGLGWALGASAFTALIGYLLAKAAAVQPFAATSVAVTGAAAVLVALKGLLAKADIDKEPMSEVFKDLVDIPKYDEQLGFIHQVEKDLRRVFDSLPDRKPMVVFIDDLDRCSPPKVAAVLEAINLFLAGDFPECYFILGMDSEMVAAALQTAHKDMISSLPQDTRIPIGWRFMDKFVQLPFVIPPTDDTQYHHFISKLTQDSLPKVLATPAQDADVAAHRPPPTPQRPAAALVLENSSEASEEREEPKTPGLAAAAVAPGVASGTASAEEYRTVMDRGIETFRDDSPEFQKLISPLAPVFRGNPRELKRFVNLFRFHFFLWWARKAQGSSVPTLEALAYWTLLSVKWPEHIRWLRRMDWKNISEDDLKRTLAANAPQTARRTNHLAVIEAAAITAAAGSGKAMQWTKVLSELYGTSAAKAAWAEDESLLDSYLYQLDTLKKGGSLSTHAGTGFW